MSENKSMLRIASEGFAITTIGDGLYKVLGIATTFIILRWLTPYDYGLWRLVLSALSAMNLILLSGIAGIAVADISRELGRGNKDQTIAIIKRISFILILAGVAATVLLVLAAPLISTISKINLTPYLWVLATSLFLGNILQILQILFQARLQPLYALIAKNVGNLSYLVGIILFIPYLELGVLGLCIAYVFSVAVPVIAFIPYLLREFRSVRGASAKTYSVRDALWTQGRWSIAADYASVLESSAWPWQKRRAQNE
ncbi:MAG: hypothetical protein JWN64_1, partial [Parcubacteria group bacterium]|nr:hypothetical protein [Parcubacteria group bacterium]